MLSILRETVDEEPGYKRAVDQWGYGNVQYRERLEAIARYACQNWKGDLLEIGCWKGETTIVLAKVAREFERRVIGVDPWQIGLQNCVGTEYDEFAERTKDYADLIHLIRMPSQWPRAVAEIMRITLCFAFVDGDHSFDVCLSDIRAVGHAPIIAVDDVRWSDDVHRAFERGAQYLERATLIYPLCKEGYILPCLT